MAKVAMYTTEIAGMAIIRSELTSYSLYIPISWELVNLSLYE
jgi:hypothetical protein